MGLDHLIQHGMALGGGKEVLLWAYSQGEVEAVHLQGGGRERRGVNNSSTKFCRYGGMQHYFTTLLEHETTILVFYLPLCMHHMLKDISLHA